MTSARLLLSISLLASIVVPSHAATLSLSSASATVGTPLSVDLSITLDPAENLFAYQVALLYPNFLSVASVTPLGYFATNGIGPSSMAGAGGLQIFDVLAGPDMMLAGSDALVRITFDTLAVGDGEIVLDPAGLILLDNFFGDVAAGTLIPGSVSVTSEIPEPGTVALAGAGLLIAAAYRHHRGRRSASNA